MSDWLSSRLHRPPHQRKNLQRLPTPIAAGILLVVLLFVGAAFHGSVLRNQRLLQEGVPVDATYIPSKTDPTKVSSRWVGTKRRHSHKEYYVRYEALGRTYTSHFDPHDTIHPQPNTTVRLIVDPKHRLNIYDPESLPWQNNLWPYGLFSLFSVLMLFALYNMLRNALRTRRASGDPTRQPPSTPV